MKKSFLFTILILSMLLAACSNKQNTANVETTLVAPEATNSTIPTPTQSTPTDVPAALATTEEDLAKLLANPWQWASFTNPMEQYDIENPKNYILNFTEDGTVNIKADCNNATGSYTVDGSSITIEIGPMTMAACPPDSRSDDFIKYLGAAAIFFFEDGNLFIDLMADGGTMQFTPLETEPAETGQVDAASLSANAWKWEKFTSPVEQVDITEPEKYIVNFLEGGVIVVAADCNTASGTYTVEGQSLKIELGPTTLAACPEGSLSEDFLKYFQSAAIFTVADGNLMIDLTADGGTMQFGVYDPLAMAREKLKANSWDEVLDRVMAGEFCDAPGVVLLADTPQGRYLKARGVASTQDQAPVQPTDKFQIGSNTKSFTTVLAMQLQEEGVWSLDDPLAKWLPDQAAKIPYGDQITLRLLGQNHTGIPDYADAVISEALTGESLDQATLEKGYTPQELVDIGIKVREPSFAPGEGWEYSTTNFILLGMAIEEATGKSLDQLYQERIFDPLGMGNSFLLNGVPEKGAFINGYYTLTNGEASDVTNWNGSQGWAGGSIVSTAEDMAKYAAGLASGALFKDPASLEQYLAFGDGPVAMFDGYGMGVGRWSRDPFAWGHAGQTPGFQSLWAVFPDQDSQVVFLTNSGSCNVAELIPILTASPDLFTQELP